MSCKGPITEEIVFRSCLLSLYLASDEPPSTIYLVTCTPLYFGVAHLHHLYESRLQHPHELWSVAVLRSAFQFTFTTIFGWYAAFIFLRSGNVYSSILVHSFCNMMGLPKLYGKLGNQTDLVTAVYYVLLIGGLLGFMLLINLLTATSNSVANT